MKKNIQREKNIKFVGFRLIATIYIQKWYSFAQIIVEIADY